MKAIVYTKYGRPDVLQLKEIENPIPQKYCYNLVGILMKAIMLTNEEYR